MKKLLSLTLALNFCFGPIAWGQNLNDTFATIKPLTDQEQSEANNYFHQGIAGEYLEKECGKLNKEFRTQLGCNDETGAPGQVFRGSVGGVLEEMIPRLYGMIGVVAAASGGGTIMMKTGTNPAVPEVPAGEGGVPAAQPAVPETDKIEARKDVCIFIPMAGEAISQVSQKISETNIQQQMADKQTQNSLADQQKESLYAVANVHKARAKTASMQAAVFAATAACYVAYVAKGAVLSGKEGAMTAVKIGAAGLVSYIYFEKAKRHKSYAEAVRKVAKGLPGDGDCNPHTQTQCFCGESTSQKVDPTNFAKVCVPPQLADNGNASPNAIPCSTIQGGRAVVDMQCSCKRNNSCLNGQLSARAASIDFGGINMADPLRLLNEMNGEFDQEKIEPIIGSINARNKNALSKMPIGNIPSVSLDNKNRALAKELNRVGLPARAAAFGAGSNIAPVNPSAVSSNSLANLPSLDGVSSGKSRTGTTYNSSSSGSSSRRANKTIAMPLPGGKAKREAVQIETFAEQALAQAEITKDTSVGIFDLISNRYRRSAWNKFDLDKEIEATPTSPSSESE